MQRGDRTGPWGLSLRSGRGLGYCAGHSHPGFMNPGLGFLFGRGLRQAGYGRGWGYPYPPVAPFAYPPFAQDEEVASLEEQAKILEDQLGQIRERLDELKKQKKESK